MHHNLNDAFFLNSENKVAINNNNKKKVQAKRVK